MSKALLIPVMMKTARIDQQSIPPARGGATPVYDAAATRGG
jgi:hypothetical protein